MNNNMLDLYKKLSLNDQRNEFSSLLLKTDKLLDELLFRLKIEKSTQAKNYDSNNNKNMSESDMLAFFYEDLWNIKNKVLSLVIASDKKEGINNE